MTNPRPIIFISCGQFSKEEKDLGNAVAGLVRTLTPYESYFAENQSTFEGLTQNIFGSLNRCAGFIGIMHHRGKISTPKGELTRASVWIEQEIAIAAFIGHTQKRPVRVTAYVEKGISLEGVREKLLLNPIEFESSHDVLRHLENLLPSWELSSPVDLTTPKLDVWVNHFPSKITRDGIEYLFSVNLKNSGEVQVDDYRIEIEFPAAFLHADKHFLLTAMEEVERSTPTHRFFRITRDNYKKTLFERDDWHTVALMSFFLDQNNDTSEAKEAICRVIVRSGKTTLTDMNIPMSELLKGDFE